MMRPGAQGGGFPPVSPGLRPTNPFAPARPSIDGMGRAAVIISAGLLAGAAAVFAFLVLGVGAFDERLEWL